MSKDMTLVEAEKIVGKFVEKLVKAAGLSEIPSLSTILRGFTGCPTLKLRKLSFMDKIEVVSSSGRYAKEAVAIKILLNKKHVPVLNEAQPLGSYVNIDRFFDENFTIIRDGMKLALSVCTIENVPGIHVQAGRHRCVLFMIIYGFNVSLPVVQRHEPNIASAKRAAQDVDNGRKKAYVENGGTNVFQWIVENGPSTGDGWQNRIKDILIREKIPMISARCGLSKECGLSSIAEDIGMINPVIDFEPVGDGKKGISLQCMTRVISNGSNLKNVKSNHWEVLMILIHNMEIWLNTYKKTIDGYVRLAKLCLDNLDMIDDDERKFVEEQARKFLKSHESNCDVYGNNMLNSVSHVAFVSMYGRRNQLLKTPDAVDEKSICSCARTCAKSSIDISLYYGGSRGKLLDSLYYMKVLGRNTDLADYIASVVNKNKLDMTAAEINILQNKQSKTAPVVPWESAAKEIIKKKESEENKIAA